MLTEVLTVTEAVAMAVVMAVSTVVVVVVAKAMVAPVAERPTHSVPQARILRTHDTA